MQSTCVAIGLSRHRTMDRTWRPSGIAGTFSKPTASPSSKMRGQEGKRAGNGRSISVLQIILQMPPVPCRFEPGWRRSSGQRHVSMPRLHLRLGRASGESNHLAKAWLTRSASPLAGCEAFRTWHQQRCRERDHGCSALCFIFSRLGGSPIANARAELIGHREDALIGKWLAMGSLDPGRRPLTGRRAMPLAMLGPPAQGYPYPVLPDGLRQELQRALTMWARSRLRFPSMRTHSKRMDRLSLPPAPLRMSEEAGETRQHSTAGTW